ncbi:MAG: hypothetical protein AB1753_07875, partial [Thermoproteota archaeon]
MLAQEEQLADRLIVGNCKDVLQKLPENSVQLTITSPPYRNAINYEMHASGSGGYYRGNAGVETAEYLDEMARIF